MIRVAIRYSSIEGWSRIRLYPNELQRKIREWNLAGIKFRLPWGTGIIEE